MTTVIKLYIVLREVTDDVYDLECHNRCRKANKSLSIFMFYEELSGGRDFVCIQYTSTPCSLRDNWSKSLKHYLFLTKGINDYSDPLLEKLFE